MCALKKSQCIGQGTNHSRIHKGVLGKGVGSWGRRKSRSHQGKMEERLFQAEEGGGRAVRARGSLCASREDTSDQLRMSRGQVGPEAVCLVHQQRHTPFPRVAQGLGAGRGPGPHSTLQREAPISVPAQQRPSSSKSSAQQRGGR